MKKYFLPIIAAIIMFAGCKLDEAGFPKGDKNLLIGKWYRKSTTSFLPAQHGMPTHTYTHTTFTANDFLTFTGKSITMSIDSFGVMDYNYSLSGSTLSLTSKDFPGEVQTQIIAKLTTDSLVLRYDGTVEASGMTNIIKVTDRYARK